MAPAVSVANCAPLLAGKPSHSLYLTPSWIAGVAAAALLAPDRISQKKEAPPHELKHFEAQEKAFAFISPVPYRCVVSPTDRDYFPRRHPLPPVAATT